MAIGDTVQAGLLKADFSPIERGGAAKGRAYSAIGGSISNALDKFAKNKQEGEAAEMGINAMISSMDDEQKEKLLSGDSEFSKTYNKFLDGELSNSQKKSFLGGLATYNTAYRQNMADQLARDKFAIQQAEERRKAEEFNTDQQYRISENQFLQTLPSLITNPELQRQADIARPGLSALGNADARNRFMQAQLDDPRNQVPVMNLNDRDFLNQFKDDPQQIKRALAFIEKRRANQPKAMTPQELADYEAKLIANETNLIKLNELKNPPVAPIPLTDGEKSRDRKFGEQLVEFNLPDINKGLEQLTEASEALSKSDTLTGPIVSLLPNFVGDRVNPEAAEVREAVEEVVQRNLRLVLGAQFTEKEGERLISRAYNPKLDEAENKKRVERLIKSIQDAAQEKLNMKSYFEKNGTLKGYNSNLPSITSIEQSAFGDSAPASQSILDEIERKKQLRSKRAGL